MSNIEILEDYIKLINKGYCEDCNELCNIYGTPAFPSKAIAEAIENLIQENKELKEKIKGLECEIEIKKYCKVDEVINDLTYYKNLAKEYQGNCIPKSKVKEKIEEYSKMINATYNDISSSGDYRRNVCFEIRKVLQELLEEGE